jgi:aminopeptidase N
VAADPSWTVLSNAEPALKMSQSMQEDAWEFATTPPIPIDLFVLCAGPWHSATWAHRGVPMGWHARRSLAGEVPIVLRREWEDALDDRS